MYTNIYTYIYICVCPTNHRWRGERFSKLCLAASPLLHANMSGLVFWGVWERAHLTSTNCQNVKQQEGSCVDHKANQPTVQELIEKKICRRWSWKNPRNQPIDTGPGEGDIPEVSLGVNAFWAQACIAAQWSGPMRMMVTQLVVSDALLGHAVPSRNHIQYHLYGCCVQALSGNNHILKYNRAYIF